MQVIGTPLATTFKASTLAEKYGVDVDTARKLKQSLPVSVDGAIGSRLAADGIAVEKAKNLSEKPVTKPVGGKA